MLQCESLLSSVRRLEAGKREKSIKVYFKESFSFLLLGDIYARRVVGGVEEPSVRRIIYKVYCEKFNNRLNEYNF